MPKSGQFAAVWTYEGKTWCSTFRRDDLGEFSLYTEDDKTWIGVDIRDYEIMHSPNVLFIKL